MPLTDRKYFWIFFVPVALVTALVYSPALSHPPRSDQIVYLTETAGQDNFFEVLQNTYSYNRTRTFMPGDGLLFRPLFFAALALEKSLWGYDFRFWQMTGIALHMLVIFLLLKVLLYIKRDSLAFLWALHFSVLFTTMEMVIWHHVHGYLVFSAVMLWSLLIYLKYREEKFQDRKKLWTMVLALTIANFLFEFGVIFSIVLAAAMFWETRRQKISQVLTLFIPNLIFLSCNILDYFQHTAAGPKNSGISIVPVPQNFLSSFETVVFLPLLSCFTVLQEKERTIFNLLDGGSNLILSLSLLTVFIGIGVFLLNRSRKQKYSGSFFLILTLVLAAAYVLFIISLRAKVSGENYLRYNMYHFYIPWIFLAIAGYCLFNLGENFSGRGKKIFTVLASLFLILNTTLNAQKVYAYNRSVKNEYAWWCGMVRELAGFIDQHKKEKDLSFQWVYRYRGGYSITLDTAKRELRGFDIDFLFRTYLNKTHAKYYLVYLSNGELLAFPDDQKAQDFLRANGLNK